MVNLKVDGKSARTFHHKTHFMENTFIITGAKPLKGTITLSGAKNNALKVLFAALLFEGTVTVHNVPRIEDIHNLLEILKSLGVKAEFIEKHTVVIDPSGLSTNKVDLLAASKIRASFLLFAPLLYKFGEAYIPNPGGCRLGARPIDRIVDGLKALGIQVSYDSETGYYHAVMKEKPSGTYRFVKPSHTGTELLIMMSVFGGEEVTIENAAQEPEIDNLITFLTDAGADIHRRENSIIIHGVKKLVQDKPHTLTSDRIEAATYAVAAIATQGDVTISSIAYPFMYAFVEKIKEAGGGVEHIDEFTHRFYYDKPLTAINLETAPFPGFSTDWQPLMAVLLTQAQGTSSIHERIYENRFSYVSELKKLGAHISFIEKKIENPQKHYHFNYQPHKEYQQTIEIVGGHELHGGVLEVADLRAGATLAVAALVACGQSYLNGIHHLERGYEDFVEKITSLGGEIRSL
ncbi:UDP-N-acetylglucosamine 1-carboxyvinyltransferase [Candidatus Woesebacteria bacterium]|nr:UDP-N-acetylglucosamine 1-carboxyvinyltransferase [Candidatus Woesebacteria bacterium]